jgi:hypothetical protein
MEASGVNVTKSLFSSDLIREAYIEDQNSQVDSDLDLDYEDNTIFTMQQCLEAHPNHSRPRPNGNKNIFLIQRSW